MASSDWWKKAVFYQIYPRSYKSASGGATGDLKGIIEKLDYVASIGIDAIWISPFFHSPMKDYGYDVSDYKLVDPMFGTNDDFDRLLEKAHSLGIKIMLDMVMSHTSNQHRWFQDSRQSKTSDKADWYVWADPKPDGTAPNNWLSLFGGAAWSYDFHREQYYLHNFLPSQPDLNVHNPDVQSALLEQCKFWLEKGVDGFRLDVINFCMHDPQLRDNPPQDDPSVLSTQLLFRDPYGMQKHIYDKSQPENLVFLHKLRKLADSYDAILLGELGDDNASKLMHTYTIGDDHLHTCYAFDIIRALPHSVKSFTEAYNGMPSDIWPSWALTNHDTTRAVSRWEPNHLHHLQDDAAIMLTALLCSVRGTPFIYQGEELGLPEAPISYDQIQDPWGFFLYPKWVGRDGCRTPIPWTKDDRNAGFTDEDVKTWLPIPDEHKKHCVEIQENHPDSVLNFARKFLAFRKTQNLLQTGNIEFIETDDTTDSILCIRRFNDTSEQFAIFNLSQETRSFNPPKTFDDIHHKDMSKNADRITLEPYGFVFSSEMPV